MCLIIFSYKNHPKYQLVFGANRDEFFNRPTQSLNIWDDHPEILAGRDLKNSGTWLGLTRDGRFSALTNYRDPASIISNAPSRGGLVKNYLTGVLSADHYLEQVKGDGKKYSGFNLIAGNISDLFYFSNRDRNVHRLQPGLYGLSNHLLDTPWPKVIKGKAGFKQLLEQEKEIDPEDIFAVLKDRSVSPDEELPDTGIGIEAERMMSSVFIGIEGYGTRCSSAVLVGNDGNIVFSERTYTPESGDGDKYSYNTKTFQFQI